MSNTGSIKNHQNVRISPLNAWLYYLGLSLLLCMILAIPVYPASAATPFLDHEAPLIQPLADNPAQGQVAALPATTPSVESAAVLEPAETPDIFSGVPDWVVYLIGGLMGTVILALILVLVTVIKIKRIT